MGVTRRVWMVRMVHVRQVGVRRVRMVRMVRMVGMVRMVHVRQVGVRRVGMVAMVAAGYARPIAVGIPTVTLRQAPAAFAALHPALTCRCTQRAKNEKEGEHVVVGRAAGILTTVGRAAGGGHAAGGHAAGDAPTETTRALSHGGGHIARATTSERDPPAVLLLLLFNTTRKPPDPQARGPLSLWTEVWPTQPAITQAVNRRHGGRRSLPL